MLTVSLTDGYFPSTYIERFGFELLSKHHRVISLISGLGGRERGTELFSVDYRSFLGSIVIHEVMRCESGLLHGHNEDVLVTSITLCELFMIYLL